MLPVNVSATQLPIIARTLLYNLKVEFYFTKKERKYYVDSVPYDVVAYLHISVRWYSTVLWRTKVYTLRKYDHAQERTIVGISV